MPWVFNGVLALAVVVLFILHFTGGEKGAELKASPGQESEVELSGDFRVAFVFIDSLLMEYDMYKDLADRLVTRKQGLESELASKGSALEKEIADFQYKVQKHLITSWEATEQEKKLGEKQQVLINLQNDMQNRLMQEEASLNQQIHDSVLSAVKAYNAARGYHLILSHTFGGGILYGADYMNVTADVLDQLNKTYRQGKK